MFYFDYFSDIDGPTPPPNGTPGIMIRHNDDEAHSNSSDSSKDFLEIFSFSVDWNSPGNSSFTGPVKIPVASFDLPSIQSYSDLSICSPFEFLSPYTLA